MFHYSMAKLTFIKESHDNITFFDRFLIYAGNKILICRYTTDRPA